jgi:hypothetical protein
VVLLEVLAVSLVLVAIPLMVILAIAVIISLVGDVSLVLSSDYGGCQECGA